MAGGIPAAKSSRDWLVLFQRAAHGRPEEEPVSNQKDIWPEGRLNRPLQDDFGTAGSAGKRGLVFAASPSKHCTHPGRGSCGPGPASLQAGAMSDALSILREITIWPLAVLGVFAFFLGILLGRIGKPSRGSRRSITTDDGTFVDLEVHRESQKARARLEQENQVFSEFFQVLTDFTREMDGRQDRSTLARRLLEIVDKIFLPSQILVFLMDRNDPGSLILRESKGIALDPGCWKRVHVGEGKIGWVARHGTAMDQDDFVREMRTGKRTGTLPATSDSRWISASRCWPTTGRSRGPSRWGGSHAIRSSRSGS